MTCRVLAALVLAVVQGGPSGVRLTPLADFCFLKDVARVGASAI